MASCDGFTEVKRRGKKRYVPLKKSAVPESGAQGSRSDDHEYARPDPRVLKEKIATCRQQLRDTQFYNDVISMLEPVHFSTIVCYGIGHIGTCHIALTQFALLTELAALYQPHSTWLYDPVLHSQELAVIRECGCEIIARNEHCKHKASEPTLFFMPHCGKAMYNNVLWANWSREQLSRIAIVGNSFNTYHEKLTSKQLSDEAPYIYHIQAVCCETPLPGGHSDDTVFNNTSLHTFPLEHTHTLGEQVWENCPEPTVDPSDPEMIT